MRTFCFFIAAVLLMALGTLGAQTQVFNQPFNINGGGYTSTWYPVNSIDYEVADNFNGLAGPLQQIRVLRLHSRLCGWLASRSARSGGALLHQDLHLWARMDTAAGT